MSIEWALVVVGVAFLLGCALVAIAIKELAERIGYEAELNRMDARQEDGERRKQAGEACAHPYHATRQDCIDYGGCYDVRPPAEVGEAQ